MTPFFSSTPYKEKPFITEFGGINTEYLPENIATFQAADMKNVSCDGYPVITVRRGHSEINLEDTNISAPITRLGKILLKRDNASVAEEGANDEYLSFVSGSNLYYLKDGEWTRAVNSGTYFSNNMSSVFFVDKTLFVAGKNTNRACYIDVDGDFGDVQANTNFPVSNFLISHANRLYAASMYQSIIYGSGLRNYRLWDSASDGVAIEFETADSENCSGLASFAERILFFKPHSVYEIYGTDPLTGYKAVNLSNSIGCCSHKSIREINGCLYFLGDKAVYEYTGGALPENIGAPIKKYLENAVYDQSAAAHGYNGKYYLWLKQKNSDGILLVFDTKTRNWYVYDNMNITDFTIVSGELYAAYTKNSVGHIIKLEAEGSDDVSWYWQSKRFTPDLISYKSNWHRLYIKYKKAQNSVFSVAVINDKGTIQEVFGHEEQGILQIELPASLAGRAAWIQLKFSGTGDAEVYSVMAHVRTKKGSF